VINSTVVLTTEVIIVAIVVVADGIMFFGLVNYCFYFFPDLWPRRIFKKNSSAIKAANGAKKATHKKQVRNNSTASRIVIFLKYFDHFQHEPPEKNQTKYNDKKTKQIVINADFNFLFRFSRVMDNPVVFYLLAGIVVIG
jgi:hypothetical protein